MPQPVVPVGRSLLLRDYMDRDLRDLTYLPLERPNGRADAEGATSHAGRERKPMTSQLTWVG